MIKFKNFIVNFFFIFLLFGAKAFADNHNVFEILELIQKDIKTLEKAVYSDSNAEDLNNLNKQNIFRSK